MKNNKNGSVHKAIAAILISATLILAVGIVVNGWALEPEEENSSDIGANTDNADKLYGDTDKNDGTADNFTENEETEEVPKAPDHFNYLTGLGIESNLAAIQPKVFCIDPNAPLYSVDGSEVIIEFPTESNGSRMLVFRTDTAALGKIGAFAPSRDYMGALVKLFGGLLVANGNDDIVNYNSIAQTLNADLSKYKNNIYRENGNSVYTDSKLLDDIFKSENIDTEAYKTNKTPFNFCEYGDEIKNKTVAKEIFIPYDDESKTTLTFDEELGEYKLLKGEHARIDMLTGNQLAFKNVFVLFADMTTYERSYGTENVVETTTKGTGYYFTCGTLCEIRWNVNSSNELIFETLSGEVLTVNRGTSYISYYKSSASADVVFY